MLDMFEKLINEHGSSVILKERIELINDKYEALVEKLSNKEEENKILKQENELLKQKIEQYEAQATTAQTNNDALPREQQAILRLLFNVNSNIRDEHIAKELKMEMGVLEYHLDELQEKDLINHPSYTMGSSFIGSEGYREQSISKNGRKYVVETLGT